MLNLHNLTRTWLGSLPGLLLGKSAALQSFFMDISIIRILYVVWVSQQWQAAQKSRAWLLVPDDGLHQMALLQDAFSLTILVFSLNGNMMKLLSTDFFHCFNISLLHLPISHPVGKPTRNKTLAHLESDSKTLNGSNSYLAKSPETVTSAKHICKNNSNL